MMGRHTCNLFSCEKSISSWSHFWTFCWTKDWFGNKLRYILPDKLTNWKPNPEDTIIWSHVWKLTHRFCQRKSFTDHMVWYGQAFRPERCSMQSCSYFWFNTWMTKCINLKPFLMLGAMASEENTSTNPLNEWKKCNASV